MDNNIKLESKSKIRMSARINITGFVLSVMAGWVDTAGTLLLVNESSSFMTGKAKMLGHHLFNLDFKLFWSILLIIIAFIVGSFISTIVTKKTGLRGGLLLTGVFVIISSFLISQKYITMVFLPMAMGCQNAATSLTPISRTTHLTGLITDIGINLAKKNFSLAMFCSWRLIGFPLGSFIGLDLTSILDNSLINKSIVLIIPAIIIMLVGVIQKRIFNIPLLD